MLSPYHEEVKAEGYGLEEDKDILGRIYEYFLGKFASVELQKGGEFYTSACLVRLMVEILEPYQGRVYDPCCGLVGCLFKA